MWSKIPAFAQRTKSLYVVASTVAIAIIAGNSLSLFDVLEWEFRDEFFRFRMAEGVDQKAVVVTINEQDIQAAGDWPIPDALLAELLQKIDSQSPRAIGLDIYRDLPEEPGHQKLIETFQSMPNLVGVEKIIGNRIKPPPALKELEQVGFADLVLDEDREVRRALLTAADEQQNGDIKAGLATQVALKYLEADGIELTLADAKRQKFQLGKASFVPLKPNEAGYSKRSLGGYQILMNWRGGTEAFITVPMADVLAGRVKADVMRDRVVFIGSVAPSTNDFFETPYSKSSQQSNQNVMPGVFIHANIASQLIQSALTGRRGITGFSGLQQALWIGFWSLAGAGISWTISSKQQQQQRYYFHRGIFLSGLSISGLLIGGSYLAFLQGLQVPIIAPLIAFGASGAIATSTYRQKQLKDANLELQGALDELQASKLQMIQSEKMSALGNLVAGVAHEINNPIGFLNGSVNNAQGYLKDLTEHLEIYQAQYPDAVEAVQENAEDIDLEFICEDFPKLLLSMQGAMDRIKAISTSLRTFSRADTEHKVTADLHEGLDSTLLILKYRLKANEARPAIEVVKAYGELPTIDCFPGQLNQVFMNLLANAIDVFDETAEKFSYTELEKNPQVITVKSVLCAEHNCVDILIGDNGKGMTADVKARIFDHLFTTKEVGKGTGLGLAIAQQIVVKGHGGTLEVRSEVGQGSEFCIRLPLT